jgi:adenylosuccinate lyase
VGAYSEIHPSVEDAVASINGRCTPAVGATQVVARDGIANWGAALASLATACEQVATWVRLGAQSGVDELAEGRTNEQVGSSSMPHKRNPVRSERICGLARVVRGHAATLANDVVLWSERDISHSSVERELLSSIANLTHYLVYETTELVLGLAVIHRNIEVNLACYSRSLTSHRDLTRRVRRGSSYWAAHEDVGNPAHGPGEIPSTTAGWLEMIGSVDHVYSALEGD